MRNGALVRILAAMGELHKRIRSAREAAGISQEAVARALGVSRSAVAQWEREDNPTSPTMDKIEPLARCLDVNPLWLAFGEEYGVLQRDVNEEFTLIPMYDVSASAGGGRVVGEERVKQSLMFRHDWLRTVTQAPIDKLAVIPIVGDSMVPALYHGDTVLVDLTIFRPYDDGIYAIQYDGSLLVKRIRIDPFRHLVTVTSDNPAYAPIADLMPEEVRVAGRIVWIGRRI